MGIKKIYIAGMDGHTIHNYDDVKSGKKKHHCYEEDYIPFEKDVCIKKDQIITNVLTNLRKAGVDLKIITPTVYKEFA